MIGRGAVWLILLASITSVRAQESYLGLDAKQAREVALGMRANGQVGKSLDLRVLATDRSYNYKLRATWMTPEVIRANARLAQLSRRLSDDQTRALVEQAEAVGGTVFLIEIDPREGSGVIPRTWQADLQPRTTENRGVVGDKEHKLREFPALAGAARRDYSYDVFWVVFPLIAPDGTPLFRATDEEAELVVRIHDKVGKVRWPLPESILRLQAMAAH